MLFKQFHPIYTLNNLSTGTVPFMFMHLHFLEKVFMTFPIWFSYYYSNTKQHQLVNCYNY